MAASADIELKRQTPDNVASFPVAAATTLYRGEMISKVDGYAVSLTSGTKFDGHVIAQVENTTAAGKGTAGDLDVKVFRGKYILQVTLAGVSELLVGAVVYAIDDNTYTLAPMPTPVGKVLQYVSSNTALVEFDTNIDRKNIGGLLGYFMDLRMPIEEGGAVGAGAGVSHSFVRTSVNGPENLTGLLANASRAANVYHNGIVILTDTAENDGESLQLLAEPFYLNSASKPFVFGTRITMDVVDESDFFLGIAITDTALLGGVTDCIAWRKVDGSTDTKLVVEKDSAETESAASEHTMVADTAVNLAFIYNGTNVTPYVNGVAGTALAVTNLPDNEALTPSIEILTGAGAAVTSTIGFLDAYQIV